MPYAELQVSHLQENRLLREMNAAMADVEARPAYVSAAIDVAAPVSDAELLDALAHLIDRHEALRTGFVVDPRDRTMGRFVADRAAWRPRVVTGCDDLDAATREGFAKLTARSMPRHEPPLMAGLLLRQSADRARLVLAVDHLVCDGWSAAVLHRELATLLRGQPLPPVGVTFGRWIERQRQRLTGEPFDRLIAYWRRTLSGMSPFPELGLPRPAAGTRPGRREVTASLPAGGFEALERLRRETRASHFVIGLAAVARAWHRHTGSADMVIHSASANRPTKDLEGTVGWLAHSVIYRLSLDASADPRSTVTGVRRTAAHAMTFQDIPLPLLVKTLQPGSHGRARRPARLYYFFEESTPPPENIPGGTTRMVRFSGTVAGAEPGLSFHTGIDDDTFTVRIVHDAAEVDAGFVDLLARGITAELTAMATVEGRR